MSRLYTATNICLAVVSVIYPLIWYFGQQYIGVTPIAVLMAVIWLVRACLARTGYHRKISSVVMVIFLCLAFIRSATAMYWYPVMVSMMMLLIFAGSLFSSQSLIERLARFKMPDLPPSGVRYTRKVTQIWVMFFIMNILITTVLIVTEQWQAWTVYTGIVAYVLMGVLFVGEFLYRQFCLKKEM